MLHDTNRRRGALRPALLPALLPFLLALPLWGCGGGGGGNNGGDELPIDLGVFPAATVVIGQADFVSDVANQGPNGSVSANGMNTPMKAPVEGSLYICDLFNSRILGYTTAPTSDNAAADFVIGQTDFTSNTSGVGTTKFDHPRAISASGNRFAVADTGNNRILLWPVLPKSNLSSKVVIGQSDFNSNDSGTTATTLKSPTDVQLAGGRMFVVDRGNKRVLIWNSIPTTSGVAADVVLGQTDFTSDGAGTTASTFASPRGVWSDGTRLAVADSSNHRVLIWNAIPTTNGAPADVVLGQPNFTSNAPGLSPSALDQPGDVSSNGTQLFIADGDNNRIVIHDVFPTTNNRPADAVVGQSDFFHGARDDLDQDGTPDGSASARTLEFPLGVLAIGNRLIVADTDNSRVLIFEN